MKRDLQAVYEMLEKEIHQYQELSDEVQRETGHIRGKSVEALIKSVHSIEEHTRAIEAVHQNIQQKIGEISVAYSLESGPHSLKTILSFLPPAEGRKLRTYQNTLERLKKGIREINQRNKSFIQEALVYWKGLFSLATGSDMRSLVYISNGQEKVPVFQPSALDRKV